MPSQIPETLSAVAAPTATPSPSLTVEKRGPECRVTITRVKKHNALSRDLLATLARAVTTAADDPSINYIVVRGEGLRYFAAGGDLADLAMIRSEAETLEFAMSSRAALDAIRLSALPVIAFLNGDALGGGAELAMACDMRIFARHARLGFVQSKLSITSAWGGGPDLCARVGPSRALRMMSRAEMISADEALSIGLADAVLDGDLDGDTARQFFEPLDAASRHVLVALKENVVACQASSTYQAARQVEQRNLIATWTHPDHWAAVDRILARPRTVNR